MAADSPMKSYYLWTIGCQMNAADSRQAGEMLEKLGFAPLPTAEEADLVILNTCVVRQSAEDRVIGRLSSLKSLKRRKRPASIVVMGCFVGDVATLQKQYPHVDLFLAPSDIEGLRTYATGLVLDQPANVQPSHPYPVSVSIPIMYGCDHHCTYCIVRLRRGPGRSLPLAEVHSEVEKAVAMGAREVTLLGQNVDAYGRDLPDHPDLADLLHAIHDVQGLERIRFLTSHPADMTNKLIATVAELPKVCEHFELPVQAGDDLILKRMGRAYTVAQYCDLVGRIRSCIPGASIATDVIVGFPGETEAQFESTLLLLRGLRFDAVHVAAYSPRPGTPAYRLPDDVPAEEKIRRRQAVEELQKRIVGEINARLLGQTVEILVEGREKGRWGGRTRTNKLAFFEDGRDWRGKLAAVRITWTGPWSLLGEASSTNR